MSLEVKGLIRFDDYVIDPSRWTIQWRDQPVALNRKSFDLLLFLIDHRDRVTSKEELLQSLWPGQYVEESNLSQHVFLVRKALSRHQSGKKIIETVSGRGYRFTAQVEIERPARLEEPLQQQVVVNSSTTITRITIEEEIEEDDEKTDFPLHEQKAISADGAPASFRATGAAVVGAGLGRRRSHSRSFDLPATRWLLIGAAAIVVLALYLVMRSNDSTRLRISSYTKITNDGRAKFIGGTDGSRIYFTRLVTSGIAEVSVSGGLQAPLPLSIQEPWSGAVSPDGSTLLIISQAGGQGPADSLWSLRLVGGSLRHLADAVLSSAWSPDGEQIVYASVNGDLFVMRRDDTDGRRIASPGGYLNSLAWSPDGDVIRFSKGGLLWDISPDGTKLHQLLPGWGKSPTQGSGAWAADGRFFFVADGQIWVLPDRHGLRLPGREKSASPVQLTFGPTVWDRPIPSPDGKKVFASGRTNRGELVRFDTESKQFKPFLSGISAEFVAFSSNRNSVAYVTYPEGILWRANVDGSNPVELTEAPVYPKSICWSPDGSQIAFTNRTADGVDAIFVIAADGSGKPQRILPEDHQAETDPTWSPDGLKIAFSTSPNVGASARSDLRILDRATGKAAIIPASEGLVVPRWSPDGRVISAMTLDTVSLRVFNLSSETWSKLDTGAVAFPEWSRDGTWIYYVRWTADPLILRIRAADGRRENVADLKGARYTGTYTLWMGLDPADAPMMLRDEGSDDIYALTLEQR